MSRRREPSRRGFTLIELLVVIAIIAILIALLVPAVQKVREAAARAQCQNNFKQMGLAMHMYNDTYKQLPAGWATSYVGGVTTAPSPGWSWSVIILPYIEQGALFNQLAPDLKTPGGPPAANALLQTPLSVYRCPSDNAPAIHPGFQSYGTSNYICNREVLGPDVNNRPTQLAVQRIPDGSSNTFLVGERDYVNNIAAVWVRSSVTSGCFEGRPGPRINPKNTATPPNSGTGTNERLAYNSLHTGGAQFLFGDGHVSFLTDSTPGDPNDPFTSFPAAATNFTLQNLQHPADGNPVSVN